MSKIFASKPSAAVRHARGRRGWWKARRPEHRPRLLRDEFSQTVERMTNRERSAWGRAGYPGTRDRQLEKLWAFVSPKRVAM